MGGAGSNPTRNLGNDGINVGPYSRYDWLCGATADCSKGGLDSDVGDLFLKMDPGDPYGTVTYSPSNFTSDDCVATGVGGWLCDDLEKILQWLDWIRPLTMQEVQEYISYEQAGFSPLYWYVNVTIQQDGWSCIPTYDYTLVGWDSVIGDYSIDGCLSISVEERCQLLYNPPICLVVIGCAIVKVACMYLTARQDREEILVTVGDAIASFLAQPDPTTAGRCWMDKSRVFRSWQNRKRAALKRKSPSINSRKDELQYPSEIVAKPLSKPKLWMQAATLLRWTVTLIL
ncbi:hypothetical protein VTN77DRAFT_2419 [Rasamsonia byssochlamydoides]|uniref:uncharacterized protein n=1 Tax=Rasamsonia byssochlamydoides TaxID=89139 RepID=UPI003744356E